MQAFKEWAEFSGKGRLKFEGNNISDIFRLRRIYVYMKQDGLVKYDIWQLCSYTFLILHVRTRMFVRLPIHCQLWVCFGWELEDIDTDVGVDIF